MATKYIVVQIQVQADGRVDRPTNVYDTLPEALARYYGILAVAAVSSIPVHSCILMTDECFELEHKCFKHEVQPAPEPEPEPEEPQGE